MRAQRVESYCSEDFFAATANGREDPSRLNPARKDSLDEQLSGGLNRCYSPLEVIQQLENSFYVGETESPVDASINPVEMRMGISHIWEKLNRYGTYEREEITRELRDSSRTLEGVVTRTESGYESLNTTKMMFVDVDFVEGGPNSHDEQTWEVTAKIVMWTQRRTEESWNVRLYRTHSGLRLMVTHAPYESVDGTFDSLCDAVGADPLFQELCHIQSCFRARLTPKPERVQIETPMHSFPFGDVHEYEYSCSWLEAYSEACIPYSTCHLICTIGSGVIHPDLVSLVTLHDDLTKVASALPWR